MVQTFSLVGNIIQIKAKIYRYAIGNGLLYCNQSIKYGSNIQFSGQYHSNQSKDIPVCDMKWSTVL